LFGLSRGYVVPTYMILGLATCYIQLAEQRLRPPRHVTYWDTPHVVRMVSVSGAMLVFLFIFVRLLARFG